MKACPVGTPELRRVGLLLTVRTLGLIVGLFACGIPASAAPLPQTEILWDTWGVPHIFAQDEADLFYAFGWAQMESHHDLLLRLYAQGRGQGAQFFGPEYRMGDQTIHLLDIPTLGEQWYAAQPPPFRRNIDAFVAGINAYAAQHPDQVAPMQALLPVTGVDVFRHWARLVALFVAENSECRALLPGLSLTTSTQRTADGWAIAPRKTVDGHTLFLAALHWPWDGELTLYEAQLTAPEINLSGAALVGLPTLFVGFNDHLGWTHTVSTLDRCDLYTLAPVGSRLTDGYRLDGRIQPITTITQTLQVAQADGTLETTDYAIQRALTGPVVAQNGQWVALHLAGLSTLPADHLLQQWWTMGKATNWSAFQQALARGTFFNVVYGDKTGQIAAFAGGNVPQRPATVTNTVADWSLPVPGDQANLVWTEAQPREALPHMIDPAAGWVQSSSGTPWYMTWPPLQTDDYPTYPAPVVLSAAPEFLREQWALKFLRKSEPLTLADLARAATSTRAELADRILDEVIAAAERSDNETAQAAAAVLARWDRQANAESRGMALFALWHRHWVAQTFMKLSAANPMLTGADKLMDSALFYATPWDPQAPLETPDGLFSPLVAVQSLESAANELRRMNLPLDAPWGVVARFQRDQQGLPGSGGSGALGIFSAIEFAPDTKKLFQAVAGTGYLAVVEFSQPLRAMTLMSYGNASQTDSPHRVDQLPLIARHTLRPVLRTRAEIEANLETRTILE